MKPLKSAPFFPASFALAVLNLPSAARANDGGIAWGGSPSLLKSHPSISMESELVQITVGEHDAIVDCRFVFKNSGRATRVRMGFPDDGEGADGFEGGVEGWRKAAPRGGFNWFRSWVDGQPTKTTIVRSSQMGKVWHAKEVSFASGARRVVRDQYSVRIGSQIARNGVYWQTAYTLHTGSSWAGRIGRSEIIVRFSRALGAASIRTIPFSSVPFVTESGDKDYVFERAMKPGVIVVSSGPGTPTRRGKSLRWVKTNWRPTAKDDIFLLFGFKTIAQLQAEYKSRPKSKPVTLPYLDTYPVKRRLKESDLDSVSGEDIRLMRNAIYARRGRPFGDAKLAKYFGSKPWYRAKANWTAQDDGRLLSTIDADNAAFLLSLGSPEN